MAQTLIEYKNVNVYQESQLVLHDVNFTVGTGEFVYITGKVGTGKSSLLKTFYGEIPVTEGDKAQVMDFDILNLRRKHLPALRRELGIIFQDFQLLTDRTVEENLRFVLKATGWKKNEDIDTRIDEVLDAVNMADSKEKLPHELSGGEQQRIAIARSLLNKPKVIIADEPTGNLDPETAENIVLLLKGITHSGTAVVMSTHNLPMLDKVPGVVYRCESNTLEEVKA